MQDVTTLIIEAQDARSRMQEAKKRIKAEVRRKYEAQITRETLEDTQDAEIEFARTLARVNASGVSQALLRREVLRTNVWSIWTYWRDLAGMEPERVTVANARAAKLLEASPFRWSEDKSVLSVVKNSLGVDVVPPLEYDMGTNRFVGKIWWPDPVGGSDTYERAVRKGDRNLNDLVSAEIQRAIDTGEIEAGEVV